MRFLPALPVLSIALVHAASAATPCELLSKQFEARQKWWRTSTGWTELAPVPAAVDLSWQPPLEVANVPHGDSYYLVLHGSAQRCYVAVCGGHTGNCRFFGLPSK
jgi:hypothetical protein